LHQSFAKRPTSGIIYNYRPEGHSALTANKKTEVFGLAHSGHQRKSIPVAINKAKNHLPAWIKQCLHSFQSGQVKYEEQLELLQFWRTEQQNNSLLYSDLFALPAAQLADLVQRYQKAK
jgi:hypothetical protein